MESSLKYTRLSVWQAVLIASPQKDLGIFLLCSMTRAISWITLFFCSTIPLCCGILGDENSWCVPWSLHKVANFVFSNYLPWSLLILAIIVPFSTCNFLHKFVRTYVIKVLGTYVTIYIYIKAEASTRCCHVRQKDLLQCWHVYNF